MEELFEYFVKVDEDFDVSVIMTDSDIVEIEYGYHVD